MLREKTVLKAGKLLGGSSPNERHFYALYDLLKLLLRLSTGYQETKIDR